MSWSPNSIKLLNITATCLSVVILLIVIFMRKIHIDSDIDFRFLPKIYSTLNAICACVLVAAYLQIKKGNRIKHKRLMTTAILISFIFLICYVIYHVTTAEIKYCKEGGIRIVYFSLLISHVVLSGLTFPFVLFTYIRGLTDQIQRHKKLARIIFPIWLYICISGPLCYVMLYPCIPS
jgi:putative membrane protein